MKHIFLCDIDGTLARGEYVAPGVASAAKAYTDAGGLLALCTGRSPLSAGPMAELIGVNMPCILYGGAMLYDFSTQEVLWKHPFQPAVMETVYMVYERYPMLSLQVFTAENTFVVRRNDRLNKRGVRADNVNPLCTLEDIHGDVLKLVFASDEHEKLVECVEALPKDICSGALSGRHFVDVAPFGFDKIQAMRTLSARYSVPVERFFCAGDSFSDLPMMLAAGRSYAPKNALPAVYEAASVQVASVDDGGMAEAFLDALRVMQEAQLSANCMKERK